MTWFKNNKKKLQNIQGGSNLFKMQKIWEPQKPVENYVVIWTQKPDDNLRAKKLPSKFIWIKLKWGWVIRVNIFFARG